MAQWRGRPAEEEEFMPRRANPTARQQRLGAELRKMRERAGVAAGAAARAVGLDQGKLSYIEAGRAAVSGDRLRSLAAHYGESDDAFVEALVAMARDRGRGWWDEYKDALGRLSLDIAELEHHATALRALQVVHIPGLLQSKDHVRSLYANTMPELSSEALEAVAEFRVRRRSVLEREKPPELDALLHEAALRIRVGDRRVAAQQLALLLDLSEHPAVTLRVVPFDTDGFTEASFPMLYASGHVERLDTAQFDTIDGCSFVDADEQLGAYRKVLDAVGRVALSPAASRDLIRRVAREL
ncbi:DUF5753 domain-containing protein [Streptomyces sp. I05A-00742]|uniref:DUF5753 domain-containing protein n=1 Tax=Streptomyces sp. I05A-00742 TaxID=2732853 RepID=UPI002017C744|nr:DUF5753 domain-containing protein [Streptomyces sp. I05A-00742]